MEFAHDHIETCGHGGHAKLREAAGGRQAVEIGVLGIAIGDMHGDRHAEVAGDLVKRIKVGVREVAIAFKRPHAHRRGAVFFCKPHFFDRVIDAHRGHDARIK